jgi:hypothetical protein
MKSEKTFRAVIQLASGWVLAIFLIVTLGSCSQKTEETMEDIPEGELGWSELEPGLELGTFHSPIPSEIGDSKVRALRIDPEKFEFRLLNASHPNQGRQRTTKEWCEENDLIAAINASMYQEDHRTSVSLMKSRDHTNNSNVTRDKMILAFDRLSPDVPRVKLIDRECDDLDVWMPKYGSLVQSIRMISCRGENVWEPQPKKWSTGAIGIDGEGRVLFIHVQSPYSTHDLIDILMDIPLGLSRAMYVEGGPESQFYVRSGGQEHEFVGSFETSFYEDNENTVAWSVPNVVGIRRRVIEPQ